MASKETCPLPYPDRFQAAVKFVAQPPADAKPLADDVRLLLFALHKQATQGSCNEPKPWSWNVIETAKWQGWNKLGDMPKTDAMRHYVNQLERIQPDWWVLAQDKTVEPETEPLLTATHTETISASPIDEAQERHELTQVRNQKLQDATAEGSWSTPYLSNASKPWPRYEHGAVMAHDKMFIIAGNCAGGRYVNDVWAFDFASLSWTNVTCQDILGSSSSALPAVAGHSLIHYGNNLLVIGGHVKSKDVMEKLAVYSLNLDTMTWSISDTRGEIPKSRGGHSATLVGHKIYVFGGEDVSRRPLNDLYVLNLDTMEWKDLSKVNGSPPASRSAHVSVACLDRYLLFFGGGSMATCFDDLNVFDTERLRWHTPTVRGRKPSPRAGHSAAILNNCWYVVGGGNNAAGCTDMAYLDLSQLNVWPMSANDESEDGVYPEGPDLDELEYELRWTIVGTIPERSYLASEGMSLVSIEESNVLVAYGGYNGRRSNAVSLFRPKTATPMHQYSLPSALSGQVGSELAADMSPNQNRDAASLERMQSLQAKLDLATKNSAAAKEAASQELSIMRKQLISAQALLQEKEAMLAQLEVQISAEKTETEKLRKENVELKFKLKNVVELEKELELLRRHSQHAANTKQGGLWGWVAGE